MALDIGPKTVDLFAREIAEASTIVWNGPMGVFEMQTFAHGTTAIAELVAGNRDAVSIVGGGDSVSAIKQAGVADRITHISTGGGASLEFLEGKVLPGVDALRKKP
jgi:phosphoglycerate kinase